MEARYGQRSEQITKLVKYSDHTTCVRQLAVIKVRVLFSYRGWEIEILAFLIITFKEWLSGP